MLIKLLQKTDFFEVTLSTGMQRSDGGVDGGLCGCTLNSREHFLPLVVFFVQSLGNLISKLLRETIVNNQSIGRTDRMIVVILTIIGSSRKSAVCKISAGFL